jgi:lycopene beta-cyclase
MRTCTAVAGSFLLLVQGCALGFVIPGPAPSIHARLRGGTSPRPAVALPAHKAARASCSSSKLNFRMAATLSEPGKETSQDVELYDVAVVGAGPAGLALSAHLGERGLKVVTCDPTLNKDWVPNYGVWIDEVEHLGLRECLMTEWPKATVFMGSSGDEKITLNRPYGRMDRIKFKQHLLERCRKAGVRLEAQPAKDAVHNAADSMLTLGEGDSASPLRCKLLVDCSGYGKAFVKFDEGKEPGVQAAYGIEADIVPGTYPLPTDEMLLMDYRDAHMKDSAADEAASEKVPTFIYCMATNSTRVFFEETSLIANPPVPFDELKRRLYKRLELWGTEVLAVHEEEFCYIPMGGAMPTRPQRVIGFGGSAGFVHPATGYMISRTMNLAAETANSIETALKKHPNDAESAASEVWSSLWTPKTLRQRDFANFGGEYLEEIGLSELRDFFGSFFVLPFKQWGGFLSHRLVEPVAPTHAYIQVSRAHTHTRRIFSLSR